MKFQPEFADKSGNRLPLYPIRWCCGGCSQHGHRAHVYSIDPVDGPLSREMLCPGNCGDAKETIDEDDEPSGWGYIDPKQDAERYLKIVRWLRNRYADADGKLVTFRGLNPTAYTCKELLAYQRYILGTV